MDQTWLTIHETAAALGSNSPDSPISSLLSWLSGRFGFERMDSVEIFSPTVGPSTVSQVVFSIKPDVVVNDTEVAQAIKDFLYKLENPLVDAYHVSTMRYLFLMIIKKVD